MQPALNAAIAVGVGVGESAAPWADFFYSNLAPYGYWVNRPSYGWAFVPRHRPPRLAPLLRPAAGLHRLRLDLRVGRAVRLGDLSLRPLGLDPDYGWEWIPGTDWGPAWVSWQQP